MIKITKGCIFSGALMNEKSCFIYDEDYFFTFDTLEDANKFIEKDMMSSFNVEYCIINEKNEILDIVYSPTKERIIEKSKKKWWQFWKSN